MKNFIHFLLASTLFLVACGMGDTNASTDSGLSPEPIAPGVLFDRPDETIFISTDIDLFWKIYDRNNPRYSAQRFHLNYVEAGSPGLQDFFSSKIRNSNRFLSSMKRYPKYYNSIRQNSLDLNGVKRSVDNSFQALESHYPDAVFGEVVFTIGAMSSGGTVVNNRIIIGTEMFTRNSETPDTELSPWLRTVTRKKSDLPLVVFHEAIHVQQLNFYQRQGQHFHPTRLLDVAIFEGAADFLTDLICNEFPNRHLHEFGNPLERQLWEAFQEEMYGDYLENWVYNGGNPDLLIPADMGYYIGYKIVESYYENAIDKQSAIKEIIEIRDFDAFLEWSRYPQKFQADS